MSLFRKILLALVVLLGGLGVGTAIGSSPAAATNYCYSGGWYASSNHFNPWFNGTSFYVCSNQTLTVYRNVSNYKTYTPSAWTGGSKFGYLAINDGISGGSTQFVSCRSGNLWTYTGVGVAQIGCYG